MATPNEVNVVNDDIVEISSQSYKDEGPWSDSSLMLFIDLMEEQVLKKNRPTTTFSKQGWKYIEDELAKRTSYAYRHDQIRNKFNVLRQTYKSFKWLIEQTGVNSYNPTTGMVTADEDKWKKYSQVNKNVKQFKRKGCPYYEKLCIIYGDTTATGSNVHPSTQAPSDDLDDECDETDHVYTPNKEFGEMQDNDEDSNPFVNPGKRVKSVLNTKNSRPKKDNFGTTITNLVTAFMENSEKRVEVMAQALSNIANTSTGSGPVCGDSVQDVTSRDGEDDLLDKCMDILNNIEDLDGASYAKAFKWLSDDDTVRKMFIKVPEHRRKELIRNL